MSHELKYKKLIIPHLWFSAQISNNKIHLHLWLYLFQYLTMCKPSITTTAISFSSCVKLRVSLHMWMCISSTYWDVDSSKGSQSCMLRGERLPVKKERKKDWVFFVLTNLFRPKRTMLNMDQQQGDAYSAMSFLGVTWISVCVCVCVCVCGGRLCGRCLMHAVYKAHRDATPQDSCEKKNNNSCYLMSKIWCLKTDSNSFPHCTLHINLIANPHSNII